MSAELWRAEECVAARPPSALVHGPALPLTALLCHWWSAFGGLSSPLSWREQLVDGGLEYLCCSIAACTRSDAVHHFRLSPSPIVCKLPLSAPPVCPPTAVLVRYNSFVLHTRKTRRGRQANTTVPTTPKTNNNVQKHAYCQDAQGPQASPAQYNLLFWQLSLPAVSPAPTAAAVGCVCVCVWGWASHCLSAGGLGGGRVDQWRLLWSHGRGCVGRGLHRGGGGEGGLVGLAVVLHVGPDQVVGSQGSQKRQLPGHDSRRHRPITWDTEGGVRGAGAQRRGGGGVAVAYLASCCAFSPGVRGGLDGPLTPRMSRQAAWASRWVPPPTVPTCAQREADMRGRGSVGGVERRGAGYRDAWCTVTSLALGPSFYIYSHSSCLSRRWVWRYLDGGHGDGDVQAGLAALLTGGHLLEQRDAVRALHILTHTHTDRAKA